jgi:hypothetical protein
MTKKEAKDLQEKVQEQREKVTSSKREARAFLVRIGVYTRSGELTEEYRTG